MQYKQEKSTKLVKYKYIHLYSILTKKYFDLIKHFYKKHRLQLVFKQLINY